MLTKEEIKKRNKINYEIKKAVRLSLENLEIEAMIKERDKHHMMMAKVRSISNEMLK